MPLHLVQHPLVHDALVALRDAATPPERMEAMRNAVAMRRLGTAEDCAGPIVFLASELSRYVTGQILHVNGGQYMP